MVLTSKQKEKISIEVIKILRARFDNFPEDASNNRNAPFHEAFLNAFQNKLIDKVPDTPYFISLASWLQGLNTTLGQTFFEKVACILCNGNKREYTSKKLGNLKITQKQLDTITEIMTNLSNSSTEPNLEEEDEKILIHDDSPIIKSPDFSADVFFVDENTITAIELKSVKPNSGEMRGEKQKILIGKAALYHEFPDKKIYFIFGFPFDPTINPEIEAVTGFNKRRFLDSVINMHKFCDLKEVLIADGLWDFLSGKENTMAAILEIINSIATPSFLSKFQLLTDNSKRNLAEYSDQLKEWHLFSELELIDSDNIIRERLDSKSIIRTYNELSFFQEGKYNWSRYNFLKELINEP